MSVRFVFEVMFVIVLFELSQALCFLLEDDLFFFSFSPSLLILFLFLTYLPYDKQHKQILWLLYLVIIFCSLFLSLVQDTVQLTAASEMLAEMLINWKRQGTAQQWCGCREDQLVVLKQFYSLRHVMVTVFSTDLFKVLSRGQEYVCLPTIILLPPEVFK